MLPDLLGSSSQASLPCPDPNNISLTVGIGTDSPQYTLDVRRIINLRGPNSTIKFGTLSNLGLRKGFTDQFLTVNEQGETVLARYRVRVETEGKWSDKVFGPKYEHQLRFANLLKGWPIS